MLQATIFFPFFFYIGNMTGFDDLKVAIVLLQSTIEPNNLTAVW